MTQEAVIPSNVLENPVVDLVQSASAHLLSKHIRISTDLHHLHNVASVPPQTTSKGKSGASQPTSQQSRASMPPPPTIARQNGVSTHPASEWYRTACPASASRHHSAGRHIPFVVFSLLCHIPFIVLTIRLCVACKDERIHCRLCLFFRGLRFSTRYWECFEA